MFQTLYFQNIIILAKKTRIIFPAVFIVYLLHNWNLGKQTNMNKIESLFLMLLLY